MLVHHKFAKIGHRNDETESVTGGKNRSMGQLVGSKGNCVPSRKYLKRVRNLPGYRRGTSWPAPLIVTNVIPL